MGPLTPDIINNDVNLIIAFFIGIAFGFLLESAGFSSSKKLAGVFYGYDFTVLRVFMTAGVTAMVGILVLAHYGLLDLDLIYINPLYLWSAIIGGTIMGFGFLIGGFCPGTSICASVIGKIDGMAFVVGIVIGIFAFIVGYPMFEGIYKGYNFGIPQLSETFNIPLGIFAFLFIITAFGLYWMVAGIERKKNNGVSLDGTSKKAMIGITIVAVVIGISATTLKPQKTEYLEKVNDASFVSIYEVQTISPDELSLRFMEKDETIQVIDIRTSKEFSTMTLPSALNYSLEEFFTRDASNAFHTINKVNIIVGNNADDTRKAYVLAKELGYENIYMLDGGLDKFKADIINFKIGNNNTAKLSDTERFRLEASQVMPKLIENAKPKVVKKVKVRALGGCG